MVARYEGKSDLKNCTQVDKGILTLINVTGEESTREAL